MASPPVLLSAVAIELRDQVAKVKRLEDEGREKEKSWLNAESERQENKAKASWDAAREQLKAAQEELAALRREREILLGQQITPGEISADNCFVAVWLRMLCVAASRSRRMQMLLLSILQSS